MDLMPVRFTIGTGQFCILIILERGETKKSDLLLHFQRAGSDTVHEAVEGVLTPWEWGVWVMRRLSPKTSSSRLSS